MVKLNKEVLEMAEKELERANEKFPQFRSRHEALGVLAEELWEVGLEVEDAKISYELIKRGVFSDIDTDTLMLHVDRMERVLALGVAEAIQSIAMLKKFKCYLDNEEDD